MGSWVIINPSQLHLGFGFTMHWYCIWDQLQLGPILQTEYSQTLQGKRPVIQRFLRFLKLIPRNVKAKSAWKPKHTFYFHSLTFTFNSFPNSGFTQTPFLLWPQKASNPASPLQVSTSKGPHQMARWLPVDPPPLPPSPSRWRLNLGANTFLVYMLIMVNIIQLLWWMWLIHINAVLLYCIITIVYTWHTAMIFGTSSNYFHSNH